MIQKRYQSILDLNSEKVSFFSSTLTPRSECQVRLFRANTRNLHEPNPTTNISEILRELSTCLIDKEWAVVYVWWANHRHPMIDSDQVVLVSNLTYLINRTNSDRPHQLIDFITNLTA